MESWADLQRMEDGAGPAPLAWTADEMVGWDEDDYEAAGLAMERNMWDRADHLESEAMAIMEDDPVRAGELALEAITLRRRADERT